MIKLYKYIKEQIAIANFLQWLSILCLLLIFYSTKTWFNIIIVAYFNIELIYLIIFLIILSIILTLQQFLGKNNPFVIFLFWLLLLITVTLIYAVYVQTFFLKDSLEYLYESEWLSIKIDYSIKYRILFAKNYLLAFYPILAEKEILIGGYLTSVDSFEKAIKLLPWDYIINNTTTFNELKVFCDSFIIEYVNYNKKLAYTIVTLIEDEKYYNSAFYNLLLFAQILSLVIFLPKVLFLQNLFIYTIPERILNTVFNDYIFFKAVSIVKQYIEHECTTVFILEMTAEERLDFYEILARLLIKHYGMLPIFLD